MIILKYNTKRTLLAEITGSKIEFNKSINMIKSLPVREYIKDKQSWIIPIIDIPKILEHYKHSDISIKASRKAKKSIKEYFDWKKSQLEIRCVGNDLYFPEMDILKEELYPFQTIGAKFIYEAGSGIITDMVGLGKTPQSLSVVQKYYNDKSINFFIILCPSSLKRNWEAEVVKFTDLNVYTINGNRPKRKKIYKSAYKYDGIIINYDLLIHDMDMIDEFIFSRGYEYAMIIDEIQYTKNSSAKRSKLTKALSRHAKFSIGLTATAIENNIMDLWSELHSIDEYILGSPKSYRHFINRYVITDWFGEIVTDTYGEVEKQKRIVEKYENRNNWESMNKAIRRLKEIETKIKNMDEIKKRILPYTIRRFKEDVLEQLPERVENNYFVGLSPIQRNFYNEMSEKIVDQISDKEKAEKISMAEVLPMIVYLRQCCLSSKLVGHTENISTKTDELMNLLNSMEINNKILVFCHFVGMIDLLHESLDKVKIRHISMHGKNCKDSKKRLEYVNEFNDNKDIRVLVTSDILREGMNITSANYIVNFDILWNPAQMEQRIGRVDRIGNLHKVINVINFVASNTVEEDVFKVQKSKQQLSSNIIDDYRVENRMTMKNIKNLMGIV